jgi:hypothetical protein
MNPRESGTMQEMLSAARLGADACLQKSSKAQLHAADFSG